mgnify:CR=1 FL=1
MNKIKKLYQVHGKQDHFKASTLEQIWGDEGLGLYSTLNEEEYAEIISEFNVTDLQRHAIKVGVVPDHQMSTTKKRLIAAFQRHVSNYHTPVDSNPSDKLSSVSKEVKKILSEGR